MSVSISPSWPELKLKLIQLLGGLIMERDSELEAHVISLGKVAFWLVFVPALYVWVAGGGKLDAGNAIRDIAPNHLAVLLSLLGYNFGKKAVSAVQSVFCGRPDARVEDDR
jgi:hypothetical protein